jgi:hypothetical protein
MPPSDRSHTLTALRNALGLTPPRQITQEAYEGNPSHLRRLTKLKPSDRPNIRDLWEYTQDLLYTEIQGDLFAYLLPFCLEIWREDLLGINRGGGGFVEQLYPVLANRDVFRKYLTEAQTGAVSQFMRESILEEIDNQRGLFYEGTGSRPYEWTTAATTYGVLFPDISRLWNDCWLLGTIGRAVAAVQCASCLMYPEGENPVFAAWTRERGGGPPRLWEFGGHLYTNRWLEQNVRFLREVLTPGSVTDLLARAVERLVGLPEHAVAVEIQSDLPLCADTLASRCTRLPEILETTQQPGVLLDW